MSTTITATAVLPKARYAALAALPWLAALQEEIVDGAVGAATSCTQLGAPSVDVDDSRDLVTLSSMFVVSGPARRGPWRLGRHGTTWHAAASPSRSVTFFDTSSQNAAPGATALPTGALLSTRRRDDLAGVRIMLVGAGGIGCELLKNCVKLGFRDIFVIDLDTIDGTNLNRQFLFRPKHVGLAKSAVAAETAAKWAEHDDPERPLKLEAFQGNVMDERFDVAWFQQFAVVVNGLDNVRARKHVNRMCMAANVPVVESGTMGYMGQVQPIRRGLSECYDCRERPPDQPSFAVCTIHAKPTTMVHCVHYAKELYARLFGDQVPAAEDAPHELAFVDGFASGATPSHWSTLEDPTARLFEALFSTKIRELVALKAKDSWGAAGAPREINYARHHVGGALLSDDHAVLTVSTATARFAVAVDALRQRDRKAFSKDDASCIGFIAAVAALRAMNFGIPSQSAYDIRTIAGSIVAAIASTNAVIAACAAAQAVAAIAQGASRFVMLRTAPLRQRRVMACVAGSSSATASSAAPHPGRSAQRRLIADDQLLLSSFAPSQPNPDCLVCSTTSQRKVLQVRVAVEGGFEKLPLRVVVDKLLRKRLGLVSPTVASGPRVLYEHEEFEDLQDAPMSQFAPGASDLSLIVSDLHQSLEWVIVLKACRTEEDEAAEEDRDFVVGKENDVGHRTTAAGAADAPAQGDGRVVGSKENRREEDTVTVVA